MDRREVAGVDIVHDAEVFPWPIEDNTCAVIMMSHLMEHVKPWLTFDVMNECWRVLEPGGVFLLVSPYATSFGMFQDPTHCNFINEAWICYFDPEHESGFWNIYQPKPWKIEKNYWQQNGNIEIALRKRAE